MTEWLDLVDAQDNVVGLIERENYWQNPPLGRYVRLVAAFVVGPRGLWIPRRSPHKRVAANCLDVSAGGHVLAGESYQAAFRREVAEELGWETDALPTRPLGHFGPQEGLSAWTTVFRIDQSQDPQPNSQDFVSGEWLTPSQLQARLSSGEQARSDLLPLITLCRAQLS